MKPSPTNLMSDQEENYVVFSLNRWDRTELALGWHERVAAFFTGRLSLENMVSHSSLGWVPVFDNHSDALAYQLIEAPGARILTVRRSLDA